MTTPTATRWISILVGTAALSMGACRSSGDRLEVPTPEREEYVDQRLTAVFATTVEHVVIGGYLTRLDGDIEGLLLQSENGGTTFRRLGFETAQMRGFLPQAIHFNDALRGWTSGVRVRGGETIPVVLRTDDGGGHWRESEVPESRAAAVLSAGELHFESDEYGSLSVRFLESEGESLIANVYETRDRGRTWTLRDFASDPDLSFTDPAEMFVSEAQGYRILPPQENGTQVLEFTGSAGRYWIPRAQLHLGQHALYY